MLANDPGDQASVIGQVSKTQKMVVDGSLLNSQHYKVRTKGKVEQFRERNSTPLHLSAVANEKGTFRSSLTTVSNFTSTGLLA